MEHAETLRLAAFLAILAAMAAWEFAAPDRRAEIPSLIRWTNNLALVALDTALVRLLIPLLPLAAADMAAARNWGLLAPLPLWAALPLAFLLLDLLIWGQHRLMHAHPLLWRFHRMHHADTEVDASTGLRFHPLEILLSTLIKIAAILALGAPALAVIAFEIVLNATSLFSHANIRLAPATDRALRRLFVTPAMHRIHHSIRREETDSNFGFNLTLWDRLFGTYRAAPQDDPATMPLGIAEFRSKREAWLDRLLTQPFRTR
ncbi:MAG: sterol desaturase family protein [Rhodobacteraceae bacterium]|nr:sterol desaturase family protein [Paracoccaceae bacterium]